MRLITAAFTATVFFSLTARSGVAAPVKYESGDIVIKNGKVIDGTGKPAVEADVLVRGGMIAAMEKLEQAPDGVQIIDATGRVVTPGFIDTHAHGDPVETPDMKNFLAMGVTTICLGQDGSSSRAATMHTWFDNVAKAQPAPNVLTFVGHGTLRTESGIKLSTQPTTLQLEKLQGLVREALNAGAFGLTTGLEYQPGTFAAKDELALVAKPVGEAGLVVMSHMRSEDDDQLTSAISELVEQCRAAGAKAHVSHIKSVYGKGSARADEIIKLLDAARDSGVTVTADIYPYTASHTGLSILFPPWALPPNSYKEVVANRRADLVDYLHKRVERRNGPEATLLGNGKNAGKTLAKLAEEMKKPYAEVLADLGPRGGSAAYFVMNEELQAKLLAAKGVNICSDGSPDMHHPRGYGSFAKVIRKFVNEDKVLTLEEAIHKMSGLSAETICLDRFGRGTLKVGHCADILVFDPAKVKDTATFEQPHLLAEGFDTILVNGALVRDHGQDTGKRNGHVITWEDRD